MCKCTEREWERVWLRVHKIYASVHTSAHTQVVKRGNRIGGDWKGQLWIAIRGPIWSSALIVRNSLYGNSQIYLYGVCVCSIVEWQSK